MQVWSSLVESGRVAAPWSRHIDPSACPSTQFGRFAAVQIDGYCGTNSPAVITEGDGCPVEGLVALRWGSCRSTRLLLGNWTLVTSFVWMTRKRIASRR